MEKTVSLSQNHRFRALYSRGKSRAGRACVVYCQRVKGNDVNRLGITVSKKLGHAVTRNRIRRRIREAYRLLEPKLEAGYDVVIVARHAAEKAVFAALTEEMENHFRQLGLLKGESHG